MASPRPAPPGYGRIPSVARGLPHVGWSRPPTARGKPINAVDKTSHTRADAADGDPRDAEARQNSPAPSDERARVILLVEDNETDQQLYGHLLWYNGYTILHATEGEEAVALALEARPDLILLDMMLEGEMTGLDVARRLRDEGVEVPMVGLSAKKKEEFGSALEEVGIRSYLEKPIDPFAVVKEVLRSLDDAGPRGSRPGGT